MKEGEESNAINQSKQTRILGMDGNNDMRKDMNAMSYVGKGEMTQDGSLDGGESEPSLIQYRSKRQCVVEREKKKKKEWWEEENVLSEEEEFEDGDSDSSDNPRKRRKKVIMPMNLLPPPPNRIFVFSTELANRAADAVIQGRVASIVAYHRAQPQHQNLLQNNRQDYPINHHPGGMGNPYRYGNYPVPEGMFPGGKPVGEMPDSQGRGGVPQLAAMSGGFNSMHQYQQYLKQQQQQHEARNTVPGVDELQHMLFGPPNGSAGPKGMMPPSSVEAQGGPPPRPTYTFPPGFRQQQMAMGNQREEQRFKFPQQQQQSFTNPSPQQLQQQAQLQQQQLQQQQLQQQQSQQQQSFSPSPAATSGPTNTTGHPPHPPPVLSPTSSASSSSPLGTSIRSPPPYPNSGRAPEANTLPGASAPSPTQSVSSPQTPHGPLTPRLPTSLASPKDGQRSPFSPGPPTSASFVTQATQQQNIREGASPVMKQLPLTRQSPNLEKSELPGEKGVSSYPMMSDSRVNFPSPRHEGTQRPNSLDLPRDPQEPQSLPPPNRSPFHPGTSPMTHHLNQMATSSPSGPHHSSKSFSVESLTAPSDKARYYRAPMQAPSPYHPAYTQQPGLFYPGQKFPPGMLGQGQYQFPPHMQSAPQQFFPPNLPPNMYLPRNSFPMHGNREGGM